MQALSIGTTVRPVGLQPSGRSNDLSRRRDTITARASRAEDDLERLESFFGAGDGFAARRHHRRGHWIDDEYVHVPAAAPEAPAEQAAAPAPEAAPPAEVQASALDKLSQRTAEQLANLQTASRHATEALREGAGAVRGQTGRLARSLQHQAEETQAALSRTADTLKQRITSGRTASTAPPALEAAPAPAGTQRKQKAAPAAAPTPAVAKKKAEVAPAAPPAAAEGPSIRERFRTEVHQGLDYLRSLSVQQLQNLEQAARSVHSGVVSKADQLQSMVATKAKTLGAHPAQQQQQKQQQQKQQKTLNKQQEKKKEAAVPTAEAQPVPNWAAALRERLPTVSVSVPAPLKAIPGEAERLRAALAANPWALAVGGAAVALAALRWAAVSSSRRGQLAEQEALTRARSRRALDRQRARFKQALDGSDDDDAAGIDSSVFAAVKQIRTTAAAASAAAVAASAGEGDEEEDDDVAKMDPELRRQWEAFVKGSRLSDAEMWDPEEVDEGLPEVYIDFEEEEED